MKNLLLILLAVQFTHCRGLENTSSEKFIGGQIAKSDQFLSVVRISPTGGSAGGSLCTAVKISPTLFLTAAHCVVAENRNGKSLNYLTTKTPLTMTGTNMRPDFKTVRRFEVHEGWKGMSAGESDTNIDLALFELQDPTPNVEIAKLDFSGVKTGDRVTIGGFGCQADENTLPSTPILDDGYKYSETIVTAVHGNFFETPPFKMNSKAQGEARGCHGDSGGPVYKKLGAGYVVVGVNSSTTASLGTLMINIQPLKNSQKLMGFLPR